MKKLLILCLSIAILCACTDPNNQETTNNSNPENVTDDTNNDTNENSDNTNKSDELTHDNWEILTKGNWEGRTESCINVIVFGEDQHFSNWCGCGSPVGDADLYETYYYQASDHTFILPEAGTDFSITGKILFADDYYLIVNVWNDTFFYENLNETRPEVDASALQYTRTDELTKPCLSVLDFKNGILSVSSHNYDGDATTNFTIWELPVSQEVSFTTVSVTIENDEASVETTTLTENDYENIGEFYTYGYPEMNREGEITNFVFYGTTTIQ